MFKLSRRYCARYRDVALLLAKYQQRELIHSLGLDRVFEGKSAELEAAHQ